MATKGIPTAEEEALQEPIFDPVFLLSSILSGGISSVPEALEKGVSRRAAQKVLSSGDDLGLIGEILKKIAKQPSPLSQILKASGRGGQRYAVMDALNNLLSPNTPKFDNWLAVASTPSLGNGALAELPLNSSIPNEVSDTFPRFKEDLNPLLTLGLLGTYPKRRNK